MAEKSPQTIEYEILCPLLAAVQGRDEDERWLLFAAFSALPEKVREILVSVDTIEQIKRWSADGLFPPTHLVAIAKLIGLVALDDVPLTSITPLLAPLGLTSEQGQKIEEAITILLQPVISFRATETIPDEMTALPPMTRPMEEGPKPLTPSVPKAKVPERNIIDLRSNG